jgi:tryptophan synthase alpha chain
MSAIDATFESLRAAGRKAFVPFITAGDPDLEFTHRALMALNEVGAAICEVGVPYSDPIADGPVIQASYSRALRGHVTVNGVLQMLRDVSTQITTPLVTMVSYSIVHRIGTERYVETAMEAGVSGLIIPDLPVEESSKVASVCQSRDVSLIQLVSPTTSQRRAAAIVNESSGFIYCVSVTGITGEREMVPEDLVQRIEWLRERTQLPICVGFGVSTPDHVRSIAPIADGVIVGSALVRRIARSSKRCRDELLSDLSDFAASMISAMEP